MKNFWTHHRKGRNAALLISLACVCVAGSEVAASRYFSPALYARLMAPVHSLWNTTRDTAEELSENLSAQLDTLSDELSDQLEAIQASLEKPEVPAEETEDQLATAPMLTEDTVCADPEDTELVFIDGQEILTGGSFEITYYNQGDDIWAKQPYGRDQIGKYGCGPTAMAMAIASMTENDVDPVSMAQTAVQNGCWAYHGGSYSSIVSKTAEAYGLTAEPFSQRTPEALCDILVSGKILVALMGPGHFTQRGHYILLRGVTLGGKVLVADPNSRDRSLMVWDPQVILDELSKTTTNGAPLWVLSLPDEQYVQYDPS